MLTDDEIEYWFTANGNHIPVKKGQSNEQALSEFLKSKGDVQGYNAGNGEYGYSKEKIENHYKWAVDNGLVSALVDFSTYINILRSINEIAIGKIAADGTKVKHITFHCVDRICGTLEKQKSIKHEGIDLKDFEYTLFYGNVKKIEKTNTIIFVSQKCKIAIDPTKGVIKQCNRF